MLTIFTELCTLFALIIWWVLVCRSEQLASTRVWWPKTRGRVFRIVMHCLLVTLVFSRPTCGQEASSEPKNSKNYSTVFLPRVRAVTGNPVPSGTLTIYVTNLSTLVTLAEGDVSRIILYVDGYLLKGMEGRLSSEQDYLQYDLKRTSESDSAWAALLGRPKLHPRKVTISVGLKNQPIPTDVNDRSPHDLNVLGGTGRFVFLVILFLVGFCVSVFPLPSVTIHSTEYPGRFSSAND